jgi:hypothetical protein
MSLRGSCTWKMYHKLNKENKSNGYWCFNNQKNWEAGSFSSLYGLPTSSNNVQKTVFSQQFRNPRPNSDITAHEFQKQTFLILGDTSAGPNRQPPFGPATG